ncbi:MULTISPECIES: glycine oxidase maturase GoxB [unclassified Marinovum]
MSEIAIIGGGLAGAAACLGLAQLGVRPLWLAAPPGQADKPGESLSPAAHTVLDSLGVADVLRSARHRPANSVFSAWGTDRLHERSSVVHLEGPGLVLDRLAFEAEMFARAQAVSNHVDTHVTGCTQSEGPWHLTHTAGLSEAAIVIDATGRHAALARNESRRFRADQLVALYAFVAQSPASDVAPTPATLLETTALGWWYAAYLADGRLVLNFYTDADLVPEGASRDVGVFHALLAQTQHIRRWINEAQFQIATAPKLASAATTWLAPCAGSNWLAVGDAAAAFDPLSSHGMTTALWTGAQAAKAAFALRRDDPEPARAYCDAVAQGVADFLAARAGFYGHESRFASAPFWQRRAARTEG